MRQASRADENHTAYHRHNTSRSPEHRAKLLASLKPADGPHAKESAKYIGAQFGRLTVQGVLNSGPPAYRTYFLVKCSCGQGAYPSAKSHILGGIVKSCGCIASEIISAAYTKHGMTGTPENIAWRAMKARCRNRKARGFKWYSDVSVCDKWKDDFAAFFADMGLKPTPKHSLDRIDPRGNYEPGNCRWATPEQQHQNIRRCTCPCTCGARR